MAKLKQGDKMPNFTFNTATEKGLSIKDVVNGKPTFFWFLRYIGCTVCRYDVHTLITRYNEFTAKGVNVVVVMQSKPEIVQRDLAGITLPFHLICDENMEMYKTLEIGSAKNTLALIANLNAFKRFLTKQKGCKANGFVHGDYEGDEMQLPAFFSVAPDLTVTEAHYAKYLTDIPTVDEMLAKIK